MFEEFFDKCELQDPEIISASQSEKIKSALQKKVADNSPQKHSNKEENIMKTKTIRTFIIAAVAAVVGTVGVVGAADSLSVRKISLADKKAADAQFDEFHKNGLTGLLYEGTLNTGGYTVQDYIDAYDKANEEAGKNDYSSYPDDIYIIEPDEDDYQAVPVDDNTWVLVGSIPENSIISQLEKHTIRINEPSYDKPVYYTYVLDLSNENTIIDGDVIKVGSWEYNFIMSQEDHSAGWSSEFAEKYTVNDRKMLGKGIALATEHPFTNRDGSIGWSRSWCEIKYVDGEGWVYNGTRCNDRLVAAIEEGIAKYGNNFTIWY